jgi:hypothetical protein
MSNSNSQPEMKTLELKRCPKCPHRLSDLHQHSPERKPALESSEQSKTEDKDLAKENEGPASVEKNIVKKDVEVDMGYEAYGEESTGVGTRPVPSQSHGLSISLIIKDDPDEETNLAESLKAQVKAAGADDLLNQVLSDMREQKITEDGASVAIEEKSKWYPMCQYCAARCKNPHEAAAETCLECAEDKRIRLVDPIKKTEKSVPKNSFERGRKAVEKFIPEKYGDGSGKVSDWDDVKEDMQRLQCLFCFKIWGAPNGQYAPATGPDGVLVGGLCIGCSSFEAEDNPRMLKLTLPPVEAEVKGE